MAFGKVDCQRRFDVIKYADKQVFYLYIFKIQD